MTNPRVARLLFVGLSLIILVTAGVQAHQPRPKDSNARPVSRPRIYLDKSPRIVRYQLNRLDNQRLLLVERDTSDPKYTLVYEAILLRAGLSPQHRQGALDGLVRLRDSNATAELLLALERLDVTDQQSHIVGRQLAVMLLSQPARELEQQSDLLTKATSSKNRLVRAIAFAGLIGSGKPDVAWSLAAQDNQAILSWLDSIQYVSDAERRAEQRSRVIELLDSTRRREVQLGAITALASIPSRPRDTFITLAPLVSNPDFRKAAIRTMFSIPQRHWDRPACRSLIKELVAVAEATPTEQRTSDEFLHAMQLADKLLSRIPIETARAYRERLRQSSVRVIRIRTIEEEMRYDQSYFAVEAGRPVQIILQNDDLMAHNLVIADRGASIKELALEGMALGPNPGFEGKPYVPNVDRVLAATNLVMPRRQQRITFTAPGELGEYPYVCTFPNHWMRMYGVMVVVDDLDVWAANPTEPADPLGFTRGLVQQWTRDDFQQDISAALLNRDPELGARVFREATCHQCHRLGMSGGQVGPDLSEVFKRHKGDDSSVLREIIDPSYRVEPEFTLYNIFTLDGNAISGIVTSENSKTITLITNPEDPKPRVIARGEIEEMIQSNTSLMPKGLMDRFTQEEIFELMAYLKGGHIEYSHQHEP